MAKNEKQIDASPVQKRIFKGTSKKIHDLYKLEVAQALVNQAWDGTIDYRKVEHVHFFHSIDSKGVPQNTSISVCGHFHVLEVVEAATATEPAKLKCSPPMIWVWGKSPRTGQMEKRLQIANHDDQHIHDVTYLDSHEFVPAKINAEFVKLQQHLTPPSAPGVIEK